MATNIRKFNTLEVSSGATYRKFKFVGLIGRQSLYTLISSLRNTISNTYDLVSRLGKYVVKDYNLISNLKKNISNSYELTSNLKLQISNAYNLSASLCKRVFKSYSLVSFLTLVFRSFRRDYFTWDICGSIKTGIQVGGTKIFAGQTIAKKVYIYIKKPGSSGSTIIDINKNGSSVFANPADRPELQFDDVDNQVEVDIDNIKFTQKDTVSIDIDQTAKAAKDLTVTLVIEPYTGYPPQIEEIQLLDNYFRMGDKTAWQSSKTRIRIRFDTTMDNTVTPVFYITDQEDQSTPVILSGNWENIRVPNDTYVTGLMDLSSGYSGKFLLSIETARNLYGTQMKRYATEIEIKNDWNLIDCESEYTNVASNEFIIDCKTAKQMRFSLDGLTWGSWVNYENKYTLDITDVSIGGSSSEEMKKMYVQFKNGDEITQGTDYFEIGYYYSPISFDSYLIQTNPYTLESDNLTNQALLRWWYGDSAQTVPIRHTNIYIDDVLEEMIKHKAYIHSGFMTALEEGTELPLKISAGSYYDSDGIYHMISNKEIQISDMSPQPADDRIDIAYIDYDLNDIVLMPGVAGKTEEKIGYKRFMPEYRIYSGNQYPQVPGLKENALNLYYCYITVQEHHAGGEPPITEIYRYFRHVWFGRIFDHGFNYNTKPLSDGAHTIKIEIVDKAGRTAYMEHEITVEYKPHINRIRAYPTEVDRIAGSNEISSGQIHNYTTLYYKIEGE